MSTRICSRCVMDTTVPGIFFDENGVCNFCKIHDEMKKQYPNPETNQKKLSVLIEKIKRDGKKKDYDCIIGVSGGLDSTYALYVAVKHGLRPLAVHVDNGWDSEIAIANIKKLVKKLNVDLYTEVLDWEEFKEIQKAFLRASVPDIELPTDGAITAVLYEMAEKKNVNYIITGQSFETGGKCPIGWSYGDEKYIKSIYKMFGRGKIKKIPYLSIKKRLYYMFFKKIKTVPILNYVEYNVKNVKNLLNKELGWEDYGIKHYESIYTRFVQSYILPKKFNIDKRKIHFSALIRSGQMTRKEALEKLKEPPYNEEKIEKDKEYVIKKLELSEEEFEEIMSMPPKMFLDYPNNFKLQKTLIKIGMLTKKLPTKYKYYTWDTIKNM